MIIRIKRHVFFHPRRCPECKKYCFISRYPKGKCCKDCHKRQRRISKNAARKQRRRNGTYKYNCHYKTRRKHMLRRQHYCALCGTEENLTTHHVGGGR